MPMTSGCTPAEPVERIRKGASRPSSRARRRDVTRTAAAPSFSPEELPAVTVPPGLKAGRRRARVSAVVSGRGCSSTSTMTGSPFFWEMGTGTVSSAQYFWSAASFQRRWLERAKASWSSRETPWRSETHSAVWPIDRTPWSSAIFGFTRRQPRVVSTRAASPRGKPASGLGTTQGARLMLSTPPATTTSAWPEATAMAARLTASRLEAHNRLTVAPGTSTGKPASRAAIRATLRLSSPAWLAAPR